MDKQTYFLIKYQLSETVWVYDTEYHHDSMENISFDFLRNAREYKKRREQQLGKKVQIIKRTVIEEVVE